MAEFRVFVEKKVNFATEAKKIKENLQVALGINTISSVRIFNRYDVSGVDREVFDQALNGIFREPQVDNFYYSLPEMNGFVFACAFLPGQYDSRADFCGQCIQLINPSAKVEVKTAKIFYFDGSLTNEEFLKIKNYLINPVESAEVSLNDEVVFEKEVGFAREIEVVDEFNRLNDSELKKFLTEKNLAMDFSDLKFCQTYFKHEEKRPPTMAEIKVIDTYWSDHCRHTTFLTSLKNIEIVDESVKKVFDAYLNLRKALKIETSPINLMDLATIGAKKLKLEGKLKSLEETDEINACSVNVDVETNGKVESWLLVFKNETHNHPTEIEPFGGAATCIGGAIRDPLSARAYVFQAMRISGAANPLQPFEETLKGKLPQRKISTTAAEGYSSYGNQIGVATGFVQELYHPGYLAKRLELGAVVGAVLKANVDKQKPQAGDVVVLLGGKTGRDGCEGAVGSSKLQTENSINVCGAQVQRGNPVEERKLQRFFKNEKVSKIIKRCNDFGAGGVCVAIGELADGLEVNLNAVPKKYCGLNEIDLAISESQERMAVVVSKENLSFLLQQAEAENLMATKVADVVEQKRLVLFYDGKKAVNLSREFLNSNGTEKFAEVETKLQKFSLEFDFENTEFGWLNLFKNLNLCSQKGLVEMFDSTIGAGCVLMPYGGKFQATKAQSMAFLFPTRELCETASIMSFGFNPFLMEQSPFFGAQYAVIESVAKLVACGGSVSKCWLTFQEYFPSLKNEPELWGQPFLALLGALNAQMGIGVASVGGKDSMSGTFEKLKVPPTLVSFAVGVCNLKNVVSAEFKKTGSCVALILPEFGARFEPNYESLLKVFSLIESLISADLALSVYALGLGGIAKAVCEMGFGNRIGFKFDEAFDEEKLKCSWFGGFLVELSENFDFKFLKDRNFKNFEIIGQTVADSNIYIKNFKVSLIEIENISKKMLESVYPTKPVDFDEKPIETISCSESLKCHSFSFKKTEVKVLVPIFPGTNCEFDLIKKFEQAGANCEQLIINNLNESKILRSVEEFVERLQQCQIIALAGGFSAGDEPDGSAKFIVSFFKNELVKMSVEKFLEKRGGLMIGICNGFQALIKLGLIEHGKIQNCSENSATLTYNAIGRHQSKLVRTRVCCNASPWLSNTKVGDVFTVPVSHGEGRFVAPRYVIEKLISNNQVATQYVDFEGNASMNVEHNPSGSFMAIEGLISQNGRILGKMGHCERVSRGLFKNIANVKEQKIFQAGVDYFKKIN